MSTGSSPDEGWYPDPSGVGRRWWDGASWTQHYQADDGAAAVVGTQPDVRIEAESSSRARTSAPSIEPGTIDPVVVAGAGGGLILLLSLFSPWVSSPFGTFNAFSGGLPWFLTGGDFEISEGQAVEGSFTSGLPHGWIFLLLALGALAVAYFHFTGVDWSGNAFLGIGVVAVLLALLNAIVMRGSKLSELAIDVGVSWGVLIAMLGGVMIAASGGLVLSRTLNQ